MISCAKFFKNKVTNKAGKLLNQLISNYLIFIIFKLMNFRKFGIQN